MMTNSVQDYYDQHLRPSGISPPPGSKISPAAWALLVDELYRGDFIGQVLAYFRVNKLWDANRDYILAEWVARRPGTRPNRWWLKDVDLPRRRQQFNGPAWDERDYWCGAPRFEWDYRPGLLPTMSALFESQAAYLLRFNLLFPGEMERLTPKDLAPVLVVPSQASDQT